jgi:hypothetical protein
MSEESWAWTPKAWVRVVWAGKVVLCYEVVYKAKVLDALTERKDADEYVRMFNLLVKESDDD